MKRLRLAMEGDPARDMISRRHTLERHKRLTDPCSYLLSRADSAFDSSRNILATRSNTPETHIMCCGWKMVRGEKNEIERMVRRMRLCRVGGSEDSEKIADESRTSRRDCSCVTRPVSELQD